MTVRMRQYVERQVIGAFVDSVLAAGHNISVNDGEETALWNSRDKAVIMATLAATDEDHLYVDAVKVPGNGIPSTLLGEVFLVYGNSGWDVICDCYGVEAWMAEADRVSDYWSQDGAWKELPPYPADWQEGNEVKK